MPFPWDEDTPQVRNRIMDNLAGLLPDVIASGRRRDEPTVDLVTDWHRRMLDGVALAEPEVVGGFRGSGPDGGRLKRYRVTVDQVEAVRPGRVRSEMSLFGRRMDEKVAALDPLIPAKAPPERREHQVIALCAWAHGEFIRIHPFADGNGRMARAVILWLETRYGLPVFVDLRPRPSGSTGYEGASRASMTGRHQLMEIALTNMLARHRAQNPDT
jgi:Fic/DOC family